jgi:histidinol-phosphatase
VAGAPTWIVDPIDVTHNYMVGIPVWATLVALRIDGTSVLGVAHAPALDETYDAAIGAGARMNGERIEVDPVDRIENATFSYSGARSFREVGFGDLFDTLTTRAWRSRGFGDFWSHLLVARGAVHIAVEPHLKLWDIAALEPIVQEAGGKLTGPNGAPWTEGEPAVTTNGSLHDEVVRLARGTRGPGG